MPTLGCVFFRTDAGSEPVREWLKEDMPASARKTMGADIRTVQATWPVGMPLVGVLGRGLWEVRSTSGGVEYRVAFAIVSGEMVLLNGFTKTTPKTRKHDLDLASGRKAALERKR